MLGPVFGRSQISQLLSSLEQKRVVTAGGLEKSSMLNCWGSQKMGGQAKCPRNRSPYILANIPRWFPSSSLNTTIIDMTLSYIVCAHLAMQILNLTGQNAILDQH